MGNTKQTLANLRQFATIPDHVPGASPQRLIPLEATSYDEAVKHDGTVFVKIPQGYLGWWIIKDGGKIKHASDTLISDIRAMM